MTSATDVASTPLSRNSNAALRNISLRAVVFLGIMLQSNYASKYSWFMNCTAERCPYRNYQASTRRPPVTHQVRSDCH